MTDAPDSAANTPHSNAAPLPPPPLSNDTPLFTYTDTSLTDPSTSPFLRLNHATAHAAAFISANLDREVPFVGPLESQVEAMAALLQYPGAESYLRGFASQLEPILALQRAALMALEARYGRFHDSAAPNDDMSADGARSIHNEDSPPPPISHMHMAQSRNDSSAPSLTRRRRQHPVVQVEPVARSYTIEQLHVRNVTEKYNAGADKLRRLSNIHHHKKVKAKSSYCALCSYTHSVVVNGKSFSKKGGARERQWCLLCRQAICKSCWVPWHTLQRLERATIPQKDLELLMEKAKRITEGDGES